MFAVALGIAFWVSRWVSGWMEQKPHPPEAPDVVVAVVDIPPGEVISGANARIVSWPTESPPPGTFTALAQVDGRVAASEINAGDPVHEQRLTPLGPSGGDELARRVERGARAVALPLDQRTVSLHPGDHVDVFVTARMEKGESFRHVTRVLAENVRILAIDEPKVKTGGFRSGSDRKIATLLLTMEQSRAVAASDRESLRLVARNRTDVSMSGERTAHFPAEAGTDHSMEQIGASWAEGMRAVTFPFTRHDGFCGWIMPDSRVDVVAVSDDGDISAESLEPGARANYLTSRKFSRILLQNVRVIATDERSRRNGSAAGDSLDPVMERAIDRAIDRIASKFEEGGRRSDDARKPGKEKASSSQGEIIGYLTLLLDDDWAERLIIASETRRLRFVYRNQTDPFVAETGGSELKHCFFRPFDERAYLVELYRGGRESLVPMPLPEDRAWPSRSPESGGGGKDAGDVGFRAIPLDPSNLDPSNPF